jgi:hypothetical protein
MGDGFSNALDDLGQSFINLLGLGGSDILNVSGKQSSAHGGTGNDKLHNGGDGDQYLHGDEGDDILIATDGNDELYGGDDNDALQGGADDDYLTGDSGSDVLAGGAGDDVLEGGDGNDFLFGGGSYEAAGFGGQTIGVLDAEGQGWVVSHVETANSNTLYLTGFNGGGQLFDDGGDVLDGGVGNDFLMGGYGDDLLIGDDGMTTFPGAEMLTRCSGEMVQTCCAAIRKRMIVRTVFLRCLNFTGMIIWTVAPELIIYSAKAAATHFTAVTATISCSVTIKISPIFSVMITSMARPAMTVLRVAVATILFSAATGMTT